MVIVMLITMVETTGDVFACADIVDKPVDKTMWHVRCVPTVCPPRSAGS